MGTFYSPASFKVDEEMGKEKQKMWLKEQDTERYKAADLEHRERGHGPKACVWLLEHERGEETILL